MCLNIIYKIFNTYPDGYTIIIKYLRCEFTRIIKKMYSWWSIHQYIFVFMPIDSKYDLASEKFIVNSSCMQTTCENHSEKSYVSSIDIQINIFLHCSWIKMV